MSDTSHSRRGFAKITETVTKGNTLMLDTSNHWPYMLVTTGNTVKAIAIALADGVTGETIPVYYLGDIIIVLGTATEGNGISPAASGLAAVAATGSYNIGIALEAATAAEFRAMLFTTPDKQQA
jgi:hypothetical protein